MGEGMSGDAGGQEWLDFVPGLVHAVAGLLGANLFGEKQEDQRGNHWYVRYRLYPLHLPPHTLSQN